MRMVSLPIHRAENSEDLGRPNVGSVWPKKEQKTTPVYVSSPGKPSLGNRRSVSRLNRSKVLEKIPVENCILVLIAPAWPTQSWFSLLREISVDHPLRLSVQLLKQMDKPFFHSNPGYLKLHAMKLQGEISRIKGSAKNFLTESWDLTKNLPGNYMEQEGASFVLSASPKKSSEGLCPLDSRFPELSFQIKEPESQNNRRI